MQARRWSEVYKLATTAAAELPVGSRRFPDKVIVLTLLWAAFNHRPISWATQRSNWPVWMQRLLPVVPSSTTMSRRLRRDSVRAFCNRLLTLAQGEAPATLVRMMDGTALEVRGHTTDRQSGFGYSAGRKASGYKLHVLVDSLHRVIEWRIAPMQTNEKVMAKRMLLKVDELAYVVADNNYDSNILHAIVTSKGGQLVSPRQAGVGNLRPKRETPGRVRGDQMLRGPYPSFGRALLHARKSIERFFANADSHAEGLGELPAWVRTHRRVHRWVHAKLIINAVRIASLRQPA